MTLSKREQKIAIAAGALLAVYLGYSYLFVPYIAERADLSAKIENAQFKLDKENTLLKNKNKVASDWNSLMGNGAGVLKTVPAQATGKTQDSLFAWARTARFDLQAVKPSAPKQDGDFQEINFQLSGEGSTASTYLFLKAIEKSDLPVKIENCRINSRKSGTDDLTVALTISTVIFAPPPTTKPAPQPTGDGTL